MECNKDEAMRAKEIAERKFDVKDFAGAKKFALKAQNLYPGVDCLSQMLATFDVYMCASNKTNGEADWYGILGVTPTADDETVRKQYRKLALMLHPDKNKSIGAEGALKLVSEAWGLLSDKSKRTSYDQRRSSRVFHQKATPSSQERTAQSGANRCYDFVNSTFSSGRVNKNTTRANNTSASGTAPRATPDTFWTVCHKCKMQYEYLRVYLNHNLLCPNCHQPFFAIETPAPVTNGSKTSTPWNSFQQPRNSNVKSSSRIRTSNVTSGGFGKAHSAASFRGTPVSQGGNLNVACAARIVQQTYEKVIREREEALAAKRRDKDMKRKYHAYEKMPGASFTKHLNFAKKRRGVEGPGLSCMNQSSLGTGSLRNGYSETIRVNTSKPYGTRELSQTETRRILIEKAMTVICKKIGEYKSNSM